MNPSALQLTEQQLTGLLLTIFGHPAVEGDLLLLADLPTVVHKDNAAWADRRMICSDWYRMLSKQRANIPYRDVKLYVYDNVGSNNNDLPPTIYPADENGRANGSEVSLDEVLKRSAAVIAMTEFSATAPLKILGKRYGFRGATMPGFSRGMIPALGLDYEAINRKVVGLKERMDRAEEIHIHLVTPDGSYRIAFDTRFREGHASGGLMREEGVVGNLPSGEAYIVPYEGEREGDPSKSRGVLPVQFGAEIVLYEIERNRAIRVVSTGVKSEEESAALKAEPAYGNIAEIGIGVLGQWGVQACGSILLDEKLGLHIAFGRSDHFGGVTAPSSFKDARNVVHIDRVYVPSVQADIRVRTVKFIYPRASEDIIIDDRLLV
jgi:hypothetical protein